MEFNMKERFAIKSLLAGFKNTARKKQVAKMILDSAEITEQDKIDANIGFVWLCSKCGNAARRVAKPETCWIDGCEGVNFVNNPNSLGWDNDLAGKEIEVGEIGTEIIVRELKTLDEGGEIDDKYLLLCEKFGVGFDTEDKTED